MPPLIAAVLCTVFIFALFYFDRKQSPEVTFAMWIPTIWLLIASSKAPGYWLGSGIDSMSEGSAANRLVEGFLLLMGLFILVKRKFNNIQFGIDKNIPLLLLITFMFLSTLWSDAPFLAMKRWIRQIGIAVVMAFVILTETHTRQTLITIFRRITYVHIPLSLILIKYYPELGRQYGRWSGELSWIGVATQKNGLALICVFTIFFYAWIFLRRKQGFENTIQWYQKYIEIFIVFLSFWLLMGPKHTLTYSATSTVCLILAFIAFLFFKWLRRRNIIFGENLVAVLIALIIFYGTITPFLGGLKLFDPSALLNRDSTLTGRTENWVILVPIAMQNPFLGRGFDSFWTDDLRQTIDANAHNGYLDIILSAGIVGLIFWSIFLINSCRLALKEMAWDYDWGIFFFCLLFMATVHNITESSMTSFEGILPAAILFLSVCIQQKNINHI